VLDELGEYEATQSAIWDLSDWTPPFLVLASDGLSRWTGGSDGIRKVFYELQEGAGSVSLREALGRMKRRSPEREYLLTRRDWLSVRDDTEAKLKVTAGDIERVAIEHIKGLLQSLAPAR
jgi:hypothetical protein